MSRAAVLIGRTLSDLVRNFFTGAVMFGGRLLVGFNPQGGAPEIAAAVGLLLLLGFAFSWIGATIGLAVRNVEAVQSAGLIWLFPLIFASSAFVPTATMPAGLRAFAEQPADHQDHRRGARLVPRHAGALERLDRGGLVRRDPRRLRAALGPGLPAGGGEVRSALAAR